MARAELATKRFATAVAWEAWLAAHHATSPGVWMKIAKAGGGATSATYAEAIAGALCVGWIDGQKHALDDRYWLQQFGPRRPKSAWSKINCDKADALIAAGKMRPAGHAAIAAAKRDGRWTAAYDSPSRAAVSPELQAALDAHPAARAAFAALDGANRYAILYRVQTAKLPATRARRIAAFVVMLAAGKTLHPPRRARAPRRMKSS